MGYDPTPEDRFAFGLWTIGHTGRDPFGEPTRAAIEPAEFVRRAADIGVWGVSYHDDDLIPFGASPADREAAIKKFRGALDATGMVVSMATTNLFTHPVFKDGAFTSNDPAVRRFAVQKVIRNLDLAAEFGARTYVFWGGREGVESYAAKDPRDALDRLREAVDFLAGYVTDRGYDMRFALEPKPNEPRGDAFLPTVGHALAFIATLEHADMVGVNPEVAHETMSGLSFYHAIAQAHWAGKLFHIDLNDQKIGRYDQDLRFASVGLLEAFYTVKLLEDIQYAGPKHFDSRPYRIEDAAGAWEFARNSMRTYKILQEKVRTLAAKPQYLQAAQAAGVFELKQPTVPPYSAAAAQALAAEQFDPAALAALGRHTEALDQVVIEHLLGG